MKTLLAVTLALSCSSGVAYLAQAQDSSATDGVAGAIGDSAGRAELEAIEADAATRELTRSERRAQRRAQRQPDPEVAQAASADGGAAAETETDGDDGLICRREIVTGSHRRVRVCATRAQREEARDSSREFVRDRMQPRGGPNTEGGR